MGGEEEDEEEEEGGLDQSPVALTLEFSFLLY